jgi:dTDP-4-dehydrorhamnose reductase
MLPKVLVLGSDGMIGSEIYKLLLKSDFDVYGSTRRKSKGPVIFIDVKDLEFEQDLNFLAPGSYVVNCIGLIRHKISKDSENESWRINSEYPKFLAQLALLKQLRLINICTDCVYSGNTGGYDENSVPDPIDVYGKSKASGESNNSSVMNLRTSVIGPEKDSSIELLSWVLSTQEKGILQGYKNHYWNGVTSFALAKVIEGIIRDDLFESGKVHLVPANEITKFDLVKEIAFLGNRRDISVVPFMALNSVNRTLSTTNQKRNRTLWKSAGYLEVPSIQELLTEVLPLSNNG